ncbi:acyl-CoA synthetase [Bradyrhizobium sp. G127]|uniref:acyl-CoA synthetase n=1 Tax=Bradyrhizobium sp. G127 TaxID=2904800 RepID=UPI001F33AE62|nr:acyl-CoA synthetase [Bradyrhizobium sp. G127]MCF2523929.1 acyl-CoA synthetase [Bradyrhizobium sp. G127]
MPLFSDYPVATLEDVVRFETEKTLEQRYDARSVYDIFAKSAARHPDRTALTMLMTGADDETPRLVTYRQMLEGITRAANFFASLGGPGAGIAYILPSLVETHFTLWGAETAGYAVPLNFLLQAQNIADLVRASEAKILVALGPHPQLDIWEKAVAVGKLLPDLKLVQVSLTDAPRPDGVFGFGPGLKEQDGSALTFGQARSGEDVAAYFHTGGTTGLPKLVTHTHRNQIAAAFGGTVLQDLTEADAITNGLPLFHVAATISCGLSFFIAGANVLVLSPAGMRNPSIVKNFWRIVERYRATVIGGVPTALAALLNVPVDADISSARYSISGASLLPRAVALAFQKMTGTTIHEILGMTETGGLVSIDPAAGEPVLGSVGVRLPYTKVVVRKLGADGSLSEACAPHEVGVMTISGPNVTPGYKDASQNSGALRAGYLDSGDLAYTDEQGRLFVAGRSKDLIIRSGHNIDPVLIEDALQSHPAVALAAAVGQPDKYAGELPVCYVALKPGAQATADELKAYAEPLIAERPAWPKQIIVIDAIPTTSVGKIFKPQLRTDAVQRLVAQVVAEVMGSGAAVIDVVAGGKRGIDVTVTLPAVLAGQQAVVEKVLDGYLFDYKVQQAN